MAQRRKNPRTLILKRARRTKALAGDLVTIMTIAAGRTVYIRSEERTEADVAAGRWHRDRLPEEHVDNRPELWVAARRDLVELSTHVHAADILIRYKLATFGRDMRGVQIGVDEAMARLGEQDRAWAERELEGLNG